MAINKLLVILMQLGEIIALFRVSILTSDLQFTASEVYFNKE